MTTVKNFTEIPSEIQALLRKAVEVRLRAYCPYSNFKVGAALLTESNQLYTGCNVENASFTVGCCAERFAFGKAISEGETQFKAIAVVAYQEQAFTTPCGACRQFMSEFNPNLSVYVAKPALDQVLVTNMNVLLPASFQALSTNQF